MHKYMFCKTVKWLHSAHKAWRELLQRGAGDEVKLAAPEGAKAPAGSVITTTSDEVINFMR